MGCRCVIVTLTGEIQMCLSLKMNPRLIQFAHVDNVWHVHLTAVPGHFSETIVKLLLIPNSTSTLFSLPQRRLSGFPHKVGIGHFPINTRAPEPPLHYLFNSHQPALEKLELEWMGKAARSGLYMNERANPWHSTLENSFSRHTLREANWAVMRSTSSLLSRCRRFNYLPCKLARAFISRRQPW